MLQVKMYSTCYHSICNQYRLRYRLAFHYLVDKLLVVVLVSQIPHQTDFDTSEYEYHLMSCGLFLFKMSLSTKQKKAETTPRVGRRCFFLTNISRMQKNSKETRNTIHLIYYFGMGK